MAIHHTPGRLLFLPITVGLWIWESGLALWLRLAQVIVVAAGWTAVMFPRPRSQRGQLANTSPGWHEVPPGTLNL